MRRFKDQEQISKTKRIISSLKGHESRRFTVSLELDEIIKQFKRTAIFFSDGRTSEMNINGALMRFEERVFFLKSNDAFRKFKFGSRNACV